MSANASMGGIGQLAPIQPQDAQQIPDDQFRDQIIRRGAVALNVPPYEIGPNGAPSPVTIITQILQFVIGLITGNCPAPTPAKALETAKQHPLWFRWHVRQAAKEKFSFADVPRATDAVVNLSNSTTGDEMNRICSMQWGIVLAVLLLLPGVTQAQCQHGSMSSYGGGMMRSAGYGSMGQMRGMTAYSGGMVRMQPTYMMGGQMARSQPMYGGMMRQPMMGGYGGGMMMGQQPRTMMPAMTMRAPMRASTGACKT